jgi:hypothetical protein
MYSQDEIVMKTTIPLLIILCLVSCNIKQGSVSIIPNGLVLNKVFINGEEIKSNKSKYSSNTEYGRIIVDLHVGNNVKPTRLEVFHENNWYRSTLEIIQVKDELHIRYKEDVTREAEEVRVKIGETIRFSWL